MKYKQDELNEQLLPYLTDDFLSTLVRCARTVGWNADHYETISFVQECYDIAGKEIPHSKDLQPFMESED